MQIDPDKCAIVIFIITILCTFYLLCIVYHKYFKVEPYQSTIDGLEYNIVSSFSDQTHEEAANMLAMINRFIGKLISHLDTKYVKNPSKTKYSAKKLKIIKNIIKRYKPGVLRENNPMTTSNTSYVLNKGTEVAFCLREKKSGSNHFHSFNDIQFVVLHELAHLGLDSYGHRETFWRTFKFLINEAYEAELYHPINYALLGNEMNYCGVFVGYSPFFDKKLDIDNI
jgi:hypothetical protein